jgi:hypothetical protein
MHERVLSQTDAREASAVVGRRSAAAQLQMTLSVSRINAAMIPVGRKDDQGAGWRAAGWP